MSAIRCVLFDLDGTLIDTNKLILTSFQHTYRHYLGQEKPEAEIYACFGEPLTRTFAKTLPGIDIDEAVQFYRAHNIQHHDSLTGIYVGIAEGLRLLKEAGLKLGVVTSKKRDMALRGLNLFGLADYFDVIVGMDDVTVHKPNPEPVWHALKQLGIQPGPDVLMIGDSHFDLRAGRQAGVRTVAVEWSALSRPLLEGEQPDFWVATFADLVAICLNQND